MIRIYFDNEFIEQKYYAGLTRSCTPYDENFVVGKTISESFKLTLNNEGFSGIPDEVKLYDDDELFATLYVDEYIVNDFTTEFTLIDHMVLLNEPYDASLIMSGEQGTSLLNIFKDICDRFGVKTDIEDFYQSDMNVTWYDNSYTARTYLEFIAEINGKNFIIDKNGKLAFSDINIEPTTIMPFNLISDYKIGNFHNITRVVWDDTNNHWEYGTNDGDTYYIRTDNVYCINEEIVEHIFNQLNGLQFYDFKTGNCPSECFKKGELISFTYQNETYNVFSKYDNVSYSGGKWFGGIDISLNSEKQQETEIIGLKSVVKGLKTIVDRDANTITNIATQTKNNTQRISGVEDSLSSYQETIQTQLSSNSFQIEALQKTVNVDGVETLNNELVKIDINGIHVATKQSAIETLMSNDNFKIISGDKTLAYFGYDEKSKSTKAEMDNLTVTNYFIAGNHRIEKFEPDGEKRTGIFYIGGNV